MSCRHKSREGLWHQSVNSHGAMAFHNIAVNVLHVVDLEAALHQEALLFTISSMQSNRKSCVNVCKRLDPSWDSYSNRKTPRTSLPRWRF